MRLTLNGSGGAPANHDTLSWHTECVASGHQEDNSSVNMRKASAGERLTSTSLRTGSSRASVLCSFIFFISTSLIVFSFRRLLERREHVSPEAVEVAAQFLQSTGVDPIDAARALGPLMDQTGLPQDAKVLRNGGTTDGQPGCQLSHRMRAAPEQLEDFSPGGVDQRCEYQMVSHD